MELNQYINKLLEKESFRKEYENQKLTLWIAGEVIRVRISKNKTQEELAHLVKTKQPSIARIESGNSLPSLKMLEKIAKALGVKLIPPSFENIKNNSLTTGDISNNNDTSSQPEPLSIYQYSPCSKNTTQQIN